MKIKVLEGFELVEHLIKKNLYENLFITEAVNDLIKTIVELRNYYISTTKSIRIIKEEITEVREARKILLTLEKFYSFATFWIEKQKDEDVLNNFKIIKKYFESLFSAEEKYWKEINLLNGYCEEEEKAFNELWKGISYNSEHNKDWEEAKEEAIEELKEDQEEVDSEYLDKEEEAKRNDQRKEKLFDSYCTDDLMKLVKKYKKEKELNKIKEEFLLVDFADEESEEEFIDDKLADFMGELEDFEIEEDNEEDERYWKENPEVDDEDEEE